MFAGLFPGVILDRPKQQGADAVPLQVVTDVQFVELAVAGIGAKHMGKADEFSAGPGGEEAVPVGQQLPQECGLVTLSKHVLNLFRADQSLVIDSPDGLGQPLQGLDLVIPQEAHRDMMSLAHACLSTDRSIPIVRPYSKHKINK